VGRRMVSVDTKKLEDAHADAAAWLVKLQGNARSTDLESAFRDWLEADPLHQEAFDKATEIWELLPGIAALHRLDRANDNPPPVYKPKIRIGAMVAAALVLAPLAAGYAWFNRDPVYLTETGEQRTATLSDGTHIALNTNSKLTVIYSHGFRRIRLDRGEAMFDVTHDPSRPFVVQVGNDQVRALGTAFVIRRGGTTAAVTLLRGRVEISRKADTNQASPFHASPAAQKLAVLVPGERALIGGDATVVLDHPQLEAVTAWRHGEVLFSNTRLADAAQELARYGGPNVVMASQSIADMRISGVFSTDKPEEFAEAVAELHGLHVEQQDGTISLAR
jgi:transmembrane sensor